MCQNFSKFFFRCSSHTAVSRPGQNAPTVGRDARNPRKLNLGPQDYIHPCSPPRPSSRSPGREHERKSTGSAWLESPTQGSDALGTNRKRGQFWNQKRRAFRIGCVKRSAIERNGDSGRGLFFYKLKAKELGAFFPITSGRSWWRKFNFEFLNTFGAPRPLKPVFQGKDD